MPDLIKQSRQQQSQQPPAILKPGQEGVARPITQSPNMGGGQNAPAYQPSRPESYTITTTSGKQYTVDRKQTEWIKSRFKSDWAGTYGADDADQQARVSGQMSAKVRGTYGDSNVDRQLAELGLPSEKNLEKYMEEYEKWHTGGIDQVFGKNVPAQAWTKMKDFYKQNWKYEDTVDDQRRKQAGMMPKALEDNYTDTEIDDQLRAAGLPSIKEFDKYAGMYNNYKGIDTLYRNAAAAYTRTRMLQDEKTGEFIKNDDKVYTYKDPETGLSETRTGKEWYAKAFYDELGREDENGNKVYADILPLLKKSTYTATDEDYVDPTKSYVEEMDKMFTAYGKAEDLADDYANHQAFSYDDFSKNYESYYDKYYKDYKFDNGQSLQDVMDVVARESDAQKEKEFWTVEDKWFDGDKGIDAFIQRYEKDYPMAAGEDPKKYYTTMFTNMFSNNVDERIVEKTRNVMRRDLNRTGGSNDVFNAITDAYATAKAAKAAADMKSKVSGERLAAEAAEYTTDDAVRQIEDYMSSNGGWTASNATGALDALVTAGVDADVIRNAVRDMDAKYGKSEYADAVKALKAYEIIGESNKIDVIARTNQLGGELDAYIDASQKRDKNDQATIDAAYDALKNRLSLYYDEDEGVYVADVDSVIAAINRIESENWNNPIAMNLALQDFGFSENAMFTGPAAEFTEGWSNDDKWKLMFNIGAIRSVDNKNKNSDFTNKLADVVGDWAKFGEYVPDKVALDLENFTYALDWARGQIAAGRLTDSEAYNILASRGFHKEMEEYMPEEWHKAVFVGQRVPEMVKQLGGAKLAAWEELDATQKREYAEGLWDSLTPEEKDKMFGDPSWWKTDRTVYRTFLQSLEQQLSMVIPGLVTDVGSTVAITADAIDAAITGRPEMGPTAQKWRNLTNYVQSYGSVNENVNGAKVASTVADITSELAKMSLYGIVGGMVGTALGGTKAIAAASSIPVVKQATGLFLGVAKASPFVLSSFASHYAEAKELGAPNSQATWYGVLCGLGEGVLESANFDNLWGKAIGAEGVAKQLANGATGYRRAGLVLQARIASAAVSGLGEWTEEGFGYVLETYLKMRHSDTWGKGTEWSIKDGLDQANMGLLIGLIGGGISSGTITDDSLLTEYALSNDEVNRKLFPDLGVSRAFWNSCDKATQQTYRDGGVNVLSSSAYGEVMQQVKVCTEDAQNVIDSYKKAEAAADAKLSEQLQELDGFASKVLGLDVSNADNMAEFANLCNKLGISIDLNSSTSIREQAKAAVTAKINMAEEVRNTAVANARAAAETSLENAELQLKELQKQIREHYAGIYLMTEKGMLESRKGEVAFNMANAYQNGATVTKDGRAQAEEAQAPAAEDKNNPWWSKQKEADAKASRPFSLDDEAKVKEAAKQMRYKGEITFVDDSDASWEGEINLETGDIKINKAKLTSTDAQRIQDNPAMWVLEHELYHYIWNRGGKASSDLAATVKKMYQEHPGIARGNAEANWNAFLDGIIAKRNEQGLNIKTRDQAEEEVVADFFRNYAFRSEEAIKSLCQTNGSLGERILSWLRYKIDSMKLRRSKDSWAREILDVERQYALALREAKNRPYNKARAEASGASEGTAHSSWVAHKITQDTTHGRSYTPGDYDFTKPFAEQIDDFLRKDGDPDKFPTNQDFLVSGTPELWKDVGFSNIPITYGPGHVADALSANADDVHALTVDEIKQLPKALENPVAIISSDSNGREGNSVVVFVNMKRMLTGRDGKPLPDRNGKQRYEQRMAAIRLDGHQRVNGRDIDSLHISSFYAKPASLLKTALDKESMGQTAVFYLNKKSAAEFLARAGVQFPGGYQVQDGINHRINDNGSPVKGLFKEQTQTEQFERWFGSQKNSKTGDVDPGEVSKFKNADNTPRIMYRVPGTTDTYKTTPSSDGEEGYYISANRIVTPKLMEEKLLPRFGSKEAVIDAIKNDETQVSRGLRVAIREDLPDGSKQFIVLNPANVKSASNNVGLFDRSYNNTRYSSAENTTDELLNEYVGKANPATGVTAEEDEAYMRAALAGDTETAGRMVRDMYERNGLMHVYRGEPKATGSWTRVNMDNFKGPSSGMFAATDIDTARASEYTHSYAREDLKTKPLSYGDEMPVLQQFADGVAQRIGRGMNLIAESYYMDDEGNTYAEDGKGREHHWALRDADTGDIFADSTELTTLADAAKRKAARLIDGNPQNTYNSIDDPFAGRILDLFVKFDNANEHNARGDEWDKIQLGSPKGVTLYRIEVTYDSENENLTTVTAYPIDESFDAESSSASEREAKSITFESEDDMDYMYKLEKAFKDMFGSKSDVAEFFMDYADWNEDGATLDRVGVRDKSGRYVSPELFPDAETTSTDELAVRDKSAGYDGSIIRNVRDGGSRTTTDTVSFNPNYIKSADAITYDDEGNIIPLSQRGDFTRNELRYSGGLDIDKLLDDMANSNNTDAEWDAMVQQYGAKPQGQQPRARDIKTPERPNQQRRFSDFLRSLVESDKVADDQIEAVKRKVVEEDWLSYVPVTEKERMQEARDFIAARQPLEAQQDFHDMVTSGKLGVKTNALGIQLMADAAARGDIESVLNIATDLQIAATEAGQSAQIFNVLKELKGVGSAWYMNGLIKKLNTQYADRIQSGKMRPITVSVELMENLAKATTIDQIANAEEAVAKEIAKQLPLTWDARLSNWRYFSMLANPTTHFRNMTGNVLMAGLNTAKNVVATGLEKALGIDQSQRAHAVLTSSDKSTWGNWTQQSYEEQARNLSGGGKLSFKTFVDQNMRSFDTKWLNALAQFNFKALEGEDIAFIRPAYKNALMQYMKAQGFTLNEKGQAGKVDAKGVFHEMTNAQKSAAVEWASQQAWKATFRDASSLATMLNKLSKENAVSKLLVEGVMPFKKTPINIARRGLEYSPAGIIMGTTQLLTKVKQGKMTAAQAIDNLASGITGSALMALGVFLAKAGLIRAGGEKEKKLETFLEDTGDQTYAMKFGDASINMSAIAPATIPLFMGVALNEMVEQSGEDVDLSTITDVLAGTLNPFMEMSFMSSLNSALKNYNSNGIGGALGGTLMTAAQNYGSQYLPTLGGKIAQFLDPTQRSTKSDATSPIGGNMDYYLRSLAKKVPGLEATLQPDVNVWGQTNTKDTFGEWALDFANKFILPTNVKVANRDAVDNELIRVVESTGVTDFLPSDGNKYFTVKGQKYNMNARQYAQYSQERGQAAYAAIKDVMASPSYVNATDEAKADMLKKAKESAYKMVNTLWKEKLGAY